MNKWDNEKQRLQQLIIDENLSYEEIGRMYKCTGNNIKKVAKRLGITLPKRRNINPSETFNKKDNYKCHNCGKEIPIGRTYCSHACQQDYQYKEYIKNWKLGINNGLRGSYSISKYIRKYMLEKSQYKCSICGWNKTNPYTGQIPLEIHHIDGDYTNNNENNLQVLCPNCHSLTSTYKGTNIGHGRIERSKQY